MKTFKHNLLFFVAVAFLSTYATFAQDQMYVIHIDHVKPSMKMEYEKVAKEFAEACKTYNLKDFDFSTFRYDDGSYVYSSPIKSYADLDKNPVEPLMEKMGKAKFQSMFERFDKCYDSHTNITATLLSGLSYIPDGKLNEGSFRKNYFFYVTPSNSKAVAQKLKEVKDLFTKKGTNQHYVVLHSGFGASEEFYVVILAAKNEMDYQKTADADDILLGNEWQTKWNELYALINKVEVVTGSFREDLSYITKK